MLKTPTSYRMRSSTEIRRTEYRPCWPALDLPVSKNYSKRKETKRKQNICNTKQRIQLQLEQMNKTKLIKSTNNNKNVVQRFGNVNDVPHCTRLPNFCLVSFSIFIQSKMCVYVCLSDTWNISKALLNFWTDVFELFCSVSLFKPLVSLYWLSQGL